LKKLIFVLFLLSKGKHVTSAGEWGYCADGCEEFPDSSEEEDIPKKGIINSQLFF